MVDEIVAVMRQAGDGRHGRRMRGLIVVLWRAGLGIHEALTLTETDLNERRGSLLVRHGKGERGAKSGIDPWAWSVLNGTRADRIALPPGPLFCVIDGPTRGRAWPAAAVRAELRHLAAQAGVRCRFAPQQLRHAHAVELLLHEGIPLPLILGRFGHAYLSATGTYLEGISSRRSSPRSRTVAWRATCQQLLTERQLYAASGGDYETMSPDSPQALGQLAVRTVTIEGQEQQKWTAGQLKSSGGSGAEGPS